MENMHKKQVEEILLYQFEPESGINTNDASDERASEGDIWSLICLVQIRRSTKSSKSRTFGALKVWFGPNADIVPYQQKLSNVFVVTRKR